MLRNLLQSKSSHAQVSELQMSIVSQIGRQRSESEPLFGCLTSTGMPAKVYFPRFYERRVSGAND